MRICHMAQGALLNALCGDLDGEEGPKRGDVCIYMADSFCYKVETSSTL